jgi:hypothetical protein
MQISVQASVIPPSPQELTPLPLLGAEERINIPQLHFLFEFNLLARYVREENPLIYVLLILSYAN